MAAKAILVLCAQAILAQTTFSQCFGRSASYGPTRAGRPFAQGVDIVYDAAITAAPYGTLAPACGAVAPLAGVAPASGGGLPVASSSPILPSGITVASDNAIEGVLAVGGDLPFVSAVGLEGALPTVGAGTVAYSCGDGSIDIVSDVVAPAVALADGVALGTGLAAPFRGAPARGLSGRGLGLPSANFGRCGFGSVY